MGSVRVKNFFLCGCRRSEFLARWNREALAETGDGEKMKNVFICLGVVATPNYLERSLAGLEMVALRTFE